MSPSLPFDTLFFIFSLLPSPGTLYREDRRLYDAMNSVALSVPLTSTRDLASCAQVCHAWNAPAQRFLIRDIRVISHAQCGLLITMTTDPAIGREVHALEFVNGIRRPGSQTLRADIDPGDVVALVKNCRHLRTLTLFGCPLSPKNIQRLVSEASFDKLTTLGLSRQDSSLSLELTKCLLDRTPQLRALGCPPLHDVIEHLPPAPTNQLCALVTHQDSLYTFWLLNASSETLKCFDPEFHSEQATSSVKRALDLVGQSIQRIRVPSAVFVSKMLPLCPNLRHLAFPILEVDFEPLLECIISPLESLTLFSNHYIGRRAKATLSAFDAHVLITAIETQATLRMLGSLDLSLTYQETAYPFAPARQFTRLKEVCAERGILFPCPDVPRLISGPNKADSKVYEDTRGFEDSWR